MKPKFRHITSLASLLAVVAFSSSANAQLLWDANNTGAAQTDGAGTWTAANQWWNGAANVTWNSVTPDSATIGNGGAGGTISLGGNVTAGTIAFGNHTGTYTIQGTAQTLTVNTGITINTNSNVTFRGTGVSPNILTLTGAGGLTMNGTGLVSMRENITTSYTGTTTINSGVLLLNGGSKPTGNFYLNGGMLTDYFTGTGVFSSGLGTGANQIRIHGASGFGAGNGTSPGESAPRAPRSCGAHPPKELRPVTSIRLRSNSALLRQITTVLPSSEIRTSTTGLTSTAVREPSMSFSEAATSVAHGQPSMMASRTPALSAA